MTIFLRSRRQREDLLLGVGVFVAALLLYVWTMAPTVVAVFDDSLEFPLVVHRLAIAHPTGYPLYTLLGKLFTLLPFGDVAYRLHLFSAVCAASAVAVLYAAVRQMGLRPLGGVAAALCLAVSPVFWSQALIAEVYALNALFIAAMLALAVAWSEGSRRFALLAALVCVFALSQTHHRTAVLVAPAIIAYMALAWRARKVEVQQPRRWPLILLAVFVLPFLIYLYIPVRGMVTSSLDGTYANTLSGFLSWVTASTYTAFLRDNPLQQEAMSVTAYARLLAQQVGRGGLVLAALGIVWLAGRRRLLLLLGLSWLTVIVFVRLYRVADAPVFLIPSFMMVAVLVGAGVHLLAGSSLPSVLHEGDALHARSGILSVARLAGVAVLALFVPGLVLASNMGTLDRSNDWTVHNYAIDVLSQPLPDDAVIVGILGEVTLLRYFQETQGMRPQVATIAADTDAERLAAVARLTREERPVYLTRPLAGIERSYALCAVGPLIQVLTPRQAAEAASQPSSPHDGLQGGVTVQAVFGEHMALVGYRLNGLPSALHEQTFPQAEYSGMVESGGRLRLTLAWQALQPLQNDYHLTVRLKTPTGRLLWQSDGRPVHGNYTTSSWRSGQTVTDVFDLLVPVGTPSGLYDVQIGVYDSTTLQMLPVLDAPRGPIGGRPDLLTIGPLSVVRPSKTVSIGSLPLHSPTPQAGLTLPGTVFDYSLERLGIQHIVRSNLQNEFTLHGYGVSAASLLPQSTGSLAPGQGVDVTLLWQASRLPSGDRVVFVQVVDADGNLWASHESQPGEGAYPTSRWQRGEVVHDVHTLVLSPDMPDGAYYLRAGMYDSSGAPLTVVRLTRRSLDYVELGIVQVRGRQRSQQIPADMRHTVNARLGNVATLVGYDAGVGSIDGAVGATTLSAQPGDTVHLRLVWRAVEPNRTSYTVFVHLVDAQEKKVSQDDSVPGRGTLPTTSWTRGEVLADMYALSIPVNAAEGLCKIVLGMYDAGTGSRLPIWDGSGASIGDSLTVPTEVRVDRAR